MNRIRSRIFLCGFAVSLALFFLAGQVWGHNEAHAQSGVLVTVTYSEPINVRGGPSTVYYPIVGRVSPGDAFQGIGVSPGREWVQVAFPDAPGGVGWLYATYVSVEGGELQIVEPPPTATPIATETINPTFAAAFIYEATSTRMPTFTPPPPLDIPHFGDEVISRPSGIASGWLAVGLLILGMVSYLATLVLKRG